MSNFKFIKFVFVFFIIAYFIIGYSPALAKFITVYPNQDEEDSNQNNGMTAAVVDAVPAKTDGEIVDCFDYYHFPSVQASFDPIKTINEAGNVIYFKGELINENNYPIIDGYLFARVARYNENYTQDGHDIVDEFFVNSGPQNAEKFYLDSKEIKKVVFSWNAPKNLPGGTYIVTFSFIVGKKMNLAGLSFTNEIIAGSTDFEIKENLINNKKIFLEKQSFLINGRKYDHVGFWPRFDKGEKIEISGRLRNEKLKKENVKLIYDLYYWDALDDKNKVSSQTEDIVVDPNYFYQFKYIIPEMNETVYYIKITAITEDGQKSIINARFVSEQEKPRINFFSQTKFPVLKGETITNFACFHNTADKDTEGKLTVNIFDKTDEFIQTFGYEGKITGDIMAVKKDWVAQKNYDFLKMSASLTDTNGRVIDSYEMIYDCKSINPKNQECIKVLEENAKSIGTNNLFNRKNILFEVMIFAVIIILSRIFFVNKTK